MISSQITNLLSTLKEEKNKSVGPRDDESTIGINEIVKKAGVFYEKIRYSIDYREEHTIRRSAIERILNRNLIFNKDGKVATILLEELIRGGYVENHKIPEKKIAEVQRIIDRFLLLEQMLVARGESTIKNHKWIMSLAATEIELFFFEDLVGELTINAFTETVKKYFKLPQTNLSPHDEETQIGLATRRSLLKSDEQTLAYMLWQKHFPAWQHITHPDEVTEVSTSFIQIERTINAELTNKLGWYLVSKFKNYGIYFSVIKEIIERYGVQSARIFSDRKLLDEEITSILENRYKKENAKTRKSSFRAVIYILFTKIILGVALELPYDFFILNRIETLALGLNTVFHPLLLYVITITIAPLGQKNTTLAISGIHTIVYDENFKVVHIKMQRSRNLIKGVFFFLYSIIFVISFGIIVYILHRLALNIVSIGLFMFFLALVSYFGLRIRYNAKRWQVVSGEEGTIAFIWNLFALPVVEVGRWLSIKFQAINIFVFIMDFIIENPYKLILKVSDAFVSFVKERREQI